MNDYDVVVVGGGAAGLSAALLLSRARRRVAVVDAGAPRNAPAAHMQGYLSRDGVPPLELLAAGRAEIEGYGGELIAGTVTGLAHENAVKLRVRLADGQELLARRVLVATGLRDELPDIPGLSGRWGRDALHCPYCHGYEVRDQPLGVLGGTNDSVQRALLIRQWSDDVVFFSHTGAVTVEDAERLAARGVVVAEGLVTRFHVGDDRLQGVALEDGSVVPRAAVFVRPHFVPNDELLAGIGCALDAHGWVESSPSGRTSVHGVWVAGNAADLRAQVVNAASEGASAAIALNAELVQEDTHHAVLARRADALG